jgi:hypothetical protein
VLKEAMEGTDARVNEYSCLQISPVSGLPHEWFIELKMNPKMTPL